MRVLLVSDFHSLKSAFTKIALIKEKIRADLTVVCGDITNFGTLQEARKLMASLTSQSHPTFFVPGNCDPPSLISGEVKDAQNIHGGCQKIENLAFIGVGGSPLGPLQTPFEIGEREIYDVLNRGYQKCYFKSSAKLVLVSHAPPLNTKVDLAFIGQHVGSESVKNFMEKTKPLAVFCGHIHEGRGIDYMGETIIVNPGPARHRYYAQVDFNGEVEVRLDRF